MRSAGPVLEASPTAPSVDLPPIWFINLDEAPDRLESLGSALHTVAPAAAGQAHRVRATNKTE
eukprot:311633-Prymnesium_polylepis.1